MNTHRYTWVCMGVYGYAWMDIERVQKRRPGLFRGVPFGTHIFRRGLLYHGKTEETTTGGKA